MTISLEEELLRAKAWSIDVGSAMRSENLPNMDWMKFLVLFYLMAFCEWMGRFMIDEVK